MCVNDGFTPMRYSRRPEFFNFNHVQAVQIVDFLPPVSGDDSTLAYVAVNNIDGSSHVPFWVKRWVREHITSVNTSYDPTDLLEDAGIDIDDSENAGNVIAYVDDDADHPFMPGDYLVSLKRRDGGFTIVHMPKRAFEAMYENDLADASDDLDDQLSAANLLSDDGCTLQPSVADLLTSDEDGDNSDYDEDEDSTKDEDSTDDEQVDVVNPVRPTRTELSELKDKFDNDALRQVALTAPTKKAIADFVGYDPTTVAKWIKKTSHQDVRQRFGLN